MELKYQRDVGPNSRNFKIKKTWAIRPRLKKEVIK